MAGKYSEDPNAVPAFTTTEASWLTELSAKAINATIDRGELDIGSPQKANPASRGSRFLRPADVLYLALRKELAPVLSPHAKSEIYEQLRRRQWTGLRGEEGDSDPGADLEIRLSGGTILRVQFKSTYKRLQKRLSALQDAKDVVVSDPEIRGGEPVIRGTRVPVFLIAELVQQGAGLKEILEDYPSLSATKVRSALAYALTRPKRGRPKRVPWK